ncbi:helix-hairpin-helix domain-containing protein [Larkinella knui]|uniref:ComEA family DNA-binding protein n=1 Tax=Larkinella knui TaxID=2025310 RepID=UPI001E4FED58|nr:helix-hairpin-helix domain-containing protein [Larkinella knui]
MKFHFPVGLLAGLLLLNQSVFSQEYRRRETNLTAFIQNLFPVQTEGIDYPTVYENLYQLYANPLDLNTASRDELSATYLLSERQLNSLFDYRTTFGPFLSIYELQAVPDFDLPTIRRLLPFVTVDTQNRSLSVRNPTDHYLIMRVERVLEQQKGFTAAEPDKNGNLPRRYDGSRQQWYLRYRYSRPRDFSFGLTLEQDPGEPFRWKPASHHYGIDYLSFHAQIQNRGRWRNILVGDYQLQIGQGLVLASGFSLGKGAETVGGVRRPSLGGRPYTSLSEYGYLRGLTATYALSKNWDVTLLAARNRRDGNVVADTENQEDKISSLQTSGLHRTPAELADRASLLEQNLGVHVLYHSDQKWQLGATVLHTVFDKSLQKRDLPYNRYEFTGKQNTVLGLHGTYLWQNVNFFGEAARSSSGGVGAVGGAVASLTKRLDAAILGRYYDRNFHSFYANAFGENTRNSNERGIYTGLRYVIYRKLTLGAFIDQYRFPWWKFLVDKPSQGYDYLLQTTYTPTKKLTVYGIYHAEHKAKNLPERLSKTKETVKTVRTNYALNAEYTPSRTWSFRTRVQWGGFQYTGFSPSNGVAIVQDATADFGRLSFSGRLAWFSTDDYDSRQYVYERDVLAAFSIPAYANKGIRNYLLVQYTLNKHFDLWLRWSRTDFRKQETAGSDLDEIAKPHKSEVKVQVRWKL